MSDAFTRAVDAEVQAFQRALAREMDRRIMGPPWLTSDRWYYKWPTFEVVPGWRRVERRHRQVQAVRREARRRIRFAWEMLKGADPYDW